MKHLLPSTFSSMRFENVKAKAISNENIFYQKADTLALIKTNRFPFDIVVQEV